MQTITEQEINKKQLNILNKAGYFYYEQLARLKPIKLYDCRKEVILNSDVFDKYGMIIGTLLKISADKSKNGMVYTKATIHSDINNTDVAITWFNTSYPAERYFDSIGKQVLCYGYIKEDTFSYTSNYSILNPLIFTDYPNKYKGKIISKMKKYRGLSDDYFNEAIESANNYDLEEYFSQDIKQKYNLYSLKELNESLHNAGTEDELKKAFSQITLEDLIYFSINLINNNKDTRNLPSIPRKEIFDKAIKELPFILTQDQISALEAIKDNVINEKTSNILVQGDVSCGKSIVAYLLMMLLMENGYQVSLLAPTVVLASQHYKDATDLFNKYGFNVKFVSGCLKKKEKAEIIEGLKSRKINAVIGTHALTSDEYEFKNLALTIIDEEQRFGVTCREKMKEKATLLAPIYVSMSATPIPRTLASCIYGDNVAIYSIKSMPNGRKPVDTYVTNNFSIPDILKSELQSGRQAYVVCASIEENDNEENDIISVQETKKKYEKALPNYRVEVVTSHTKDTDMLKIMEDFKNGLINVLISTTVIEVGVNNPNASVIVIQNAERFGLSTLHQLRGRVKRGSYKPYCILMSKDVNNERLQAIRTSEDGFVLSQMDLNLRKTGNLIGTEQSGRNYFVDLLVSKPNTYEKARLIAKEIIERKEDTKLISIMQNFYK